MKTQIDCIPCMFRQAINTARLLTDDQSVIRRILLRVADWTREISLDNSPAINSKPIYLMVSEVTGISDPYAQQKKATNRGAIALLPELRKFIRKSPDPLDAALHIAIAGNVIDMGIGHSFDFNREIEEILEIMNRKLGISDLPDLKKELRPGTRLLYLADNAGEIVFDRLLIEQLRNTGVKITLAVKSAPIINDATMEDARVAGLTRLVKVISTGGNDVGVNWNNISREFMNTVNNADIILAKGHGNFETCDDRPENFYFLLKIKCEMVANQIGGNLGDLIFKHSRRRRTPVVQRHRTGKGRQGYKH